MRRIEFRLLLFRWLPERLVVFFTCLFLFAFVDLPGLAEEKKPVSLGQRRKEKKAAGQGGQQLISKQTIQ